VALGKQSLGKKVVCVFSYLSVIFIYVLLSSFAYCLLLIHKGGIGAARVGVSAVESGNSLSGGLGVSIHQIELQIIDESRVQDPNEIRDARLRAENQRQNEIRASIRSLKTNILIVLVIIIFAVINTDPMPYNVRAYIISFVKASSPVITTVANFGKVKEYLSDIKEIFLSNYF